MNSLRAPNIGNRHSQHTFALTPQAVKPRSNFDRSFGVKGTCDADNLYPFFLDLGYPGDTYKLNSMLLFRLCTQLVPVMDNMYLDTFFFKVPLRLLWSNWQKFMGEQDSPGDSIDFTIPKTRYIAAGGVVVGELGDYFGLPTGIAANVRNIDVTAFPFRSYNLIWSKWFRDENMQNAITNDTGNGPDTLANYILRKRGKRFDYFTGSLTAPQKGVGVNLPLGTTAPIILKTPNTGNNAKIRVASTGALTAAGSNLQTSSDALGNFQTTDPILLFLDPNGTLVTDLTNATAATINSLRLAYNIQRLLEKDARGGTRYIESIWSHFGVRSDDARLQNPEFLGGSSSMLNMTPVAVTADNPNAAGTYGAQPGQLTSAGVFHSGRNGFVTSLTEHCIIMGLFSIRTEVSYQQGLERFWSLSTRYDMYFPVLANLGEQSVLNKEIYFQNDAAAAVDNAVFGYQERFSELRYKPSMIVGKLRSTFATSLDLWHWAEKFTTLPTLGSTFIQSNSPVTRAIAVTDEPAFVYDIWHQFHHTRVMPVNSVPGWDNRF